jgi:hypothetical protein
MPYSTTLLVSTLASTLAQILAGEQPAAPCYSTSKAREHPSLRLRGRQMSYLSQNSSSSKMTDPQRSRQARAFVKTRVLVVVALAVDPPPWTPDPRSRNSHTANPASALQENGAQICAYDQTGGLSFPMQSCIRILQGSAASTFKSVHARESGKALTPDDSISNKQKPCIFPVLLKPHLTPPRWSCGP